MPVVTVPATDRATAALADWLIRDLTAVMLEQAGLPDPQRLRRLPTITAAHIGTPGKLRRHARALEQTLAQVERHLRAGAHLGEHGLGTASVPAVPGELLDVAADLAGTVAERGSPAAALANRAVLLAAGVIGRGLGRVDASQAWSATAGSYCATITQLWRDEPQAQVLVDPG
ncbi:MULTISPECIES: hypothetical protein [Rhodococcus]|nr:MULTISPECIES: hypothetical protein [Rhodococcus]KHJ71823.1 hypothetical protein QR64_16085 [Rhodococcus sp. Chr-9]MCD2140913.1 hypothetical protein [Rhodococcus pyridinivorans]UPK61925.1 hypothetical protein MYP14_13780 [Rhodococcus pyridinivorans]UTM39991.1 hypothetical protein MX572_24800 [Rhodococcus pyridinivorans]